MNFRIVGRSDWIVFANFVLTLVVIMVNTRNYRRYKFDYPQLVPLWMIRVVVASLFSLAYIAYLCEFAIDGSMTDLIRGLGLAGWLVWLGPSGLKHQYSSMPPKVERDLETLTRTIQKLNEEE